MATLTLTMPTAGTQNIIALNSDINLLSFDFDYSQALFEKSENNELVINFEDGSSIVLDNFYEVYSSNFMPDFEIDEETTILGEQFFTAIVGDDSLMPAAGNQSGSTSGDLNASNNQSMPSNTSTDHSNSRQTGESIDGNAGNARSYSRTTHNTQLKYDQGDDSGSGAGNNAVDHTPRYFIVNETTGVYDNLSSVATINTTNLKPFAAEYQDDIKLNQDGSITITGELQSYINTLTPGQVIHAQVVTAEGTFVLELTGNNHGADHISTDLFEGKGTILENEALGHENDGEYTHKGNNLLLGEGNDIVDVNSMTSGRLNTGEGQDTINVETLSGGHLEANDDNDIVNVGTMSGDDTELHGGRGDDEITVDNLKGGEVHGAYGSDTINIGTMTGGTVLADNDELTGKEAIGDDTVNIGSISGGTVLGGKGDDTINIGANAGAGWNGLIKGSLEGTVIDTGEGDDIVHVGNRDNNNSGNDPQDMMYGGTITTGAGNDQVYVEGISGTSRIYTGSEDDTVTLGQISSHSTDVLIDTGSGNDTVNVGTDKNAFNQTMASGVINTGEGEDTVNIINAFSGGTINTGSEKDIININSMNGGVGGTVNAGTGNDEITVANIYSAGATINGDEGNDTITVTGKMQAGTINGGEGADTITVGSMVGGTINAGKGKDSVTIENSMSNATITTGKGKDTVTIEGNATSSSIDTGNGRDKVTIEGNLSDSSITTGNGRDKVTVEGTMYSGTISTGKGNDTVNIEGSVNAEAKIITGKGADSVTIGVEGQNVLVNGTIETGEGNDVINVIGSVKHTTLDSGSGDDIITVGSETTNYGLQYGTINAGDGNDTITLQSRYFHGDGTINGGAGDDIITIAPATDFSNASRVYDGVIDGGADNDTIKVDEIIGGDILGGTGDDTITARYVGRYENGKEATTLDGGDGNDTITVGGINDDLEKGVSPDEAVDITISGGEGNDTFGYNTVWYNHGTKLELADNGDVTITRPDGTVIDADINQFENLTSGDGSDILVGNKHDNILTGGKGSDTLTGNGGADTFKFDATHFKNYAEDRITDFDALEGDVLDIASFEQNGYTVTSAVVGADLVYTVSKGNESQKIILEGVATPPAVSGETGTSLTFNEANLENGTNPDASALTQSGSFIISNAQNVASIVVAGTTISLTDPTTVNAAGFDFEFTVTKQADGSYKIEFSAVLDDNVANNSNADLVDQFDIVVNPLHGEGSTTVTVTTSIDDDTPELTVDGDDYYGYQSAIVGQLTAVGGADELKGYIVDGTFVEGNDGDKVVLEDGSIFTFGTDGSYTITNIKDNTDVNVTIQAQDKDGTLSDLETITLGKGIEDSRTNHPDYDAFDNPWTNISGVHNGIKNDSLEGSARNDTLKVDVKTEITGEARGLNADKNSQTTTIDSKEGNDLVEIKVDSEAVSAGMRAASGGENYVLTGAGNDKVVLNVASDSSGGMGQTYGMQATIGAKNDIDDPDKNGTVNEINTGTGDDIVEITAINSGSLLTEDIAYGMYARNGKDNTLSENRILTGEGADTVTITADGGTNEYGMYAEATTGATANNKIETGEGADVITVTNMFATAQSNGIASNTVDSGADNDTITIGSMDAKIEGILSGTDAYNLVNAGEGDDVITVKVMKNGEIQAGDGNDIVYVENIGSEAIINGGAGKDLFVLNNVTGNTIALNDDGSVDINGNAMNIEGFESIGGGDGADFLYGNANDNDLFGGAGEDTLFGGAGNDNLFGGAGDDTFVFEVSTADQSDVIKDYEAGELLDLTAYKQAGYTCSAATVGENTVFTLTGNEGTQTITLEGFTSTDQSDIDNALKDYDANGTISL